MIEDTPISSFKEITYEILPPNTKNTLFAEDVITSTEVSGQELLQNEIIGPFILNQSETIVNKIGIDIALQEFYQKVHLTIQQLSSFLVVRIKNKP